MKTKIRKRLLCLNDDRVIANQNENRQVYHFKFEEELNGLEIDEVVIEGNSIIPRIGETITIPEYFIIKCVCFTNNEFENKLYEEKKYRELNKFWGEDVLDYFFPQKIGELKKDYKHRLYKFILKHSRRDCSDLKETSGDHIMADCILDIMSDIKYKVVGVDYGFHSSIEPNKEAIPKMYIKTNIYLLGKKKDFKWE